MVKRIISITLAMLVLVAAVAGTGAATPGEQTTGDSPGQVDTDAYADAPGGGGGGGGPPTPICEDQGPTSCETPEPPLDE